jgi:hypothetical protein
MQVLNEVLLGLLIILIVVNAYACWRVCVGDNYERGQKTMQCAIIWLSPFLGAALCLYLLRDHDSKRRRLDNQDGALLDDSLLDADNAGGDYLARAESDHQ